MCGHVQEEQTEQSLQCPLGTTVCQPHQDIQLIQHAVQWEAEDDDVQAALHVGSYSLRGKTPRVLCTVVFYDRHHSH